jgi:5-methylcytosine-specific restriction endonuclease McrA
MIPVVKQPEPDDFNQRVRIPGQEYLKTNPAPKSKEFDHHRYWSRIKPELYQLYRGICAYTGEWFPNTAASVDHFIPKSKKPQLAYELERQNLVEGIGDIFKPLKTI